MAAIFYIPNRTRVMRPHHHGAPAARPPRKRRLQGALAGFGVGGGLWWRLCFLWARLSEIPETLKTRFQQPKPPAPRPALPRHEHT